MTRVCALLSWYDEDPVFLADTVASLAGVVDHLVAVDGAYALFMEGKAASPVEQQLSLVKAAAAARIPVTLRVPACVWVSEVEKRNACLEVARAVLDGDGWWVFVVDADHRVTRHVHLREKLAATSCDVAFYELAEAADPDAKVYPRGIYRLDASLRYERSHYVVRNDAGYLWGHERFHVLQPAADVSGELGVAHFREREPKRARRSLDYYRARDAQNVEALEVMV